MVYFPKFVNFDTGTPTVVDTSIISFTQAGTGAVQRTLDSKIKGDVLVSVVDFGAVADDATDNATAFSNAYNAIVAKGGGTMYAPAGRYRASSLPTFSTNSISFIGDGAFAGGGTVIRDTNTTNNFLNITAQYNCIKDIYFFPTVRKSAGYQVSIAQPAADTLLDRIRIDYACNGISIIDSSATQLNRVQLRFLLGTQGISYSGTNGNGSFGAYFDHTQTDNPYPIRAISNTDIKTWATSTGFTSGQVINNNGNIYQCSTTGTSSNVGTGPSGFPNGTTPDTVFTNTIIDGSCQWMFVCSNALTWIVEDSFSNSLTMVSNQLLDGAFGFRMLDTANTGSSFPQFFSSFDLGVDHPFNTGVELTGGNSAMFANAWIGSALTSNGVLANTNFKGEIQITNSRIAGNNGNGILFQSGPVNNLVSNSVIENNSAGTAPGVNHGISIAANASHLIINGNRIGAAFNGGNNQGSGIFITSGTSDFLVITDNDLNGNVNSGLSNGAPSGTNNLIADNPGYNPIGITAGPTTMGASPFTVTAGASKETHYVRQSATNTATVTKNGQQIASLAQSNTFYAIDLGPSESYVTTWLTTAPTFTRDVH